MSTLEKIRFTLDEAQDAADAWRFNCGPGAICAVTGMTPDELRPRMLDFESKGYTNPTLMLDVLRGLNVPFKQIYRGDSPNCVFRWPQFGLVRIQFAGPWTKDGVPMAARYRHTHWVAMRCREFDGVDSTDVFDINAMCCGGWLPYDEWAHQLIPWLIRECVPKATGAWWPTHCLEIVSEPTP